MSHYKCNRSFFSSVTQQQFHYSDLISLNKYSILPYEEKMNFKKVEEECTSCKTGSSSPEFDSFLSSINNDSSPSVDFGSNDSSSSTDFGGGDFGGGGASSDF